MDAPLTEQHAAAAHSDSFATAHSDTFAERLACCVAERQADLRTAVDVVRLAMERAECEPDLRGEQRKLCVMEALQALLGGNMPVGLLPQLKDGLIVLVDNVDVLVGVIDVIVAASKGHLDLNKTASLVSRIRGRIGWCCS